VILPRYLARDAAAKHRGIRSRIPEVIDAYISGGAGWPHSPVDINDVEFHKKTQPGGLFPAV